MILKASTINSWTRAPLKNFTEVLALVFPQILQKENGKLVFYNQAGSANLLQVPRESVYLLDLMNVRWLITKLKLPVDKRFDFEEEDRQPIFIYKNDRALNRAFLTGSVRQAGSREEALKQMATGNLDYRSAILVSDPLVKSLACPEKDGQASESRGSVHIGRPSPDQFSARTSSPCPSWLFSSETYYPGWKAFLDGKEARIFVADYAFRAVAVPAGEHEIQFSYQPVSFRIGLYAGFAALINILIILANKNNWRKSGPTAVRT